MGSSDLDTWVEKARDPTWLPKLRKIMVRPDGPFVGLHEARKKKVQKEKERWVKEQEMREREVVRVGALEP